jgi:BRCA1-like protein
LFNYWWHPSRALATTRLHPTQKLSWVLSLKLDPNRMSLFDGVTFYCTSTLSDKRKTDLTLLLEHNGARRVPLGEATHIITLSLDYEGQDGTKEGSVTITVRLSWARGHACVNQLLTLQDSWVDRSLILGRIQLYVSGLALEYCV